MKHLHAIIIVILVTTLTVSAQGTFINGKLKYTRVYNVYHKSAEAIFHQAIHWASFNGKIEVDSTEMTVSFPFTMKYKGDGSDCIGPTVVKGRIILFSKENRAKMDAIDMTYTHYNEAGEKVKIDDVSATCKASGNIEDLYSCSACSIGKDDLFEKLYNEFMAYSKEYKTQLVQFSRATADTEW